MRRARCPSTSGATERDSASTANPGRIDGRVSSRSGKRNATTTAEAPAMAQATESQVQDKEEAGRNDPAATANALPSRERDGWRWIELPPVCHVRRASTCNPAGNAATRARL